MNISYDYYKIFYYAARYRNLTLAAQRLYIDQPNITRTIKNLEHELGCTLFVRSNRGVTLTPEGERLYRHIETAVEQIIIGEEELSSERSLRSGSVSIAVSEVSLHCCLLPVLGEFHRKYPKIKLRISNNNTPDALTALRNKAADIAVVTLPESKAAKGLVCTPVKEVSETAIISAKLDKFAGKTVSIKKLCSLPMISLGRDTATYALYDEWFHSLGITFSPDVEASTAGQIIPMVKAGLGIGFVPDDFLQNDTEMHSIELKEKLPIYRICFVKRGDDTLGMAARQLPQQLPTQVHLRTRQKRTTTMPAQRSI